MLRDVVFDVAAKRLGQDINVEFGYFIYYYIYAID